MAASLARPVTAPDRPGRQSWIIDRRGGWAIGGVAALVVLGLAVLIVRAWPPLLESDVRIDVAIHAWALDNAWAVRAAEVLQTMGYFPFSFWVVTATTAVLLVGRRWRVAGALVLVAALAPLVANLIKPVVGRSRPLWEQTLGSEVSLSYPSGHATAGIAVYAGCAVALTTLMRSHRWSVVVATAGIAFGIAMGLSRLVLGVHWPSDVVGGWGVALAVAGTVCALLVLPPARERHR
jgi:undecaprenyl-diphosphatase